MMDRMAAIYIWADMYFLGKFFGTNLRPSIGRKVNTKKKKKKERRCDF